MKAPTKPVRPQPPHPPNKDKKVHKHAINIDHLFRKETYFNDDGKEISKEEYDGGDKDGAFSFDKETEDLTPSIKDLLALVPAGTNTDDIYLDLDTSQECPGNHPMTLFDGLSIFYTTPYSYEDELAKYNKAMAQYEKEVGKYKLKAKQYKVDMEQYKAYKEQQSIQKKKELLKEQLAALEKP